MMLMVNHLIGFGVARSLVESVVPGGAGSIVSNTSGGNSWTGGNPTTNAFDGNTSTWAQTAVAATWITMGKYWGSGSGKIPAKVDIWGRPGAGYVDGASPTVTATFYASNTGFESSPVNLGSVSITSDDPSQQTIISSDQNTVYEWWWIEISGGIGTAMFIAEVQFTEMV